MDQLRRYHVAQQLIENPLFENPIILMVRPFLRPKVGQVEVVERFGGGT